MRKNDDKWDEFIDRATDVVGLLLDIVTVVGGLVLAYAFIKIGV